MSSSPPSLQAVRGGTVATPPAAAPAAVMPVLAPATAIASGPEVIDLVDEDSSSSTDSESGACDAGAGIEVMHGHVPTGSDMDTDVEMDTHMFDQLAHGAQDIVAIEATPRIAALALSSPLR